MEPPPPTAFDLERDWPALSERLRAKLAAYKVPPALRDDLVQETGLRLLELGDKLDPTRSISALAATIAVNLLRDHLRKQKWVDPIVDLESRLDSTDVENEVIARDEWQRVCAAIQRLTAEQRDTLLAEIGAAVTPPGRSTTAVRMLRMRGRRQLHALLEEVSRLRAAVTMTFGDVCDRVAVRLTRVTASVQGRGDDVAQAGGALAVLLTASMLVLQPGIPGTPPPEGARRPVVSVPLVGATEVSDSISAGHRLVDALTIRAETGAARDARVRVRRARLKDPVRRLDLGPLGYAEGGDDEVVGIVAAAVDRATASPDRITGTRLHSPSSASGRVPGMSKAQRTAASLRR